MKRTISLIIILLIFALIPYNVFAADVTQSDERIYLDDGSYFIISIDESSTRSTKTATKTHEYHASDGELLWKVQVRGTFSYNGTSSTCTSATHTITIYNSSWYTHSQTSYSSGNKAIANVTMKKKTLGIVTSTRSVNLTLACDKDGNLS